MGFPKRYDGELRETLFRSKGGQVSMCMAMGSGFCSRVMVGESGLKTGRRTLKVFLGSQQETLGSLDLSW